MSDSVSPALTGGDDPQAWRWTAETLFYGGQTLWEVGARYWKAPARRDHPAEPGQALTALLLFGYAFENALKGLHAQAIAAAGKGGIPLIHDLPKLAVGLGLTLAQDEEDLLRRLQEFVMWTGRYPVPKNAKGLPKGDLVPNASFHPDDGALVERTFQKLLALYDPRYSGLL
jgi:hypothetical protein